MDKKDSPIPQSLGKVLLKDPSPKIGEIFPKYHPHLSPKKKKKGVFLFYTPS